MMSAAAVARENATDFMINNLRAAIFPKFRRQTVYHLHTLRDELYELGLVSDDDDDVKEDEKTPRAGDSSKYTQGKAGSKRHPLGREEYLKLKDYQETILRLNQINKLAEPTGLDVKFCGHMMGLKTSDESTAENSNSSHWLDEPEDLLSLFTTNNEPTDRLTAFVVKNLDWLAKMKLISVKQFDDLECGSKLKCYDFNEKTFAKAVFITAGIIMPVMIVSSVFILYWLHSMPVRLLVIFIFVCLFYVMMLLLSRATVTEAIAASAAYAAVLVVFVSTSNT